MPNRDFFRIRFSAPRMNAADSEAEILLYGEIIQDMPEDWKWSKEDKSAADFDKAIKAARDGGARKLLLRINSPGGIVSEAVAMRSILCAAGFENITVRIEGLCASAATIIAAIPGAHVQIAPGSEYMIHNPWAWAVGGAETFERTAQHLRSEEATARAFYAQKTGQADEQIKAWMDAETWFTAEDAVRHGFCDELLSEDSNTGKIAACVTPRTMSVMKGMYQNIPPTLIVREDSTPRGNISNTAPPAADGTVTENTQSKEETRDMDITNMTPEQLLSENPALYNSIMQAGGEQERQRLQDIDDLTPAGYEAMAQEAKENGTSAMEYHKAIIRAQREKGQRFLAQRRAETEPAAQVTGGASEDANGRNTEQEIKSYAEEMAGYSRAAHASLDGGMY